MMFASDNWAGASQPIVDALAAAATVGGPAYGGDRLTRSVEERFSALFERQVAVFMVASGTAANAFSVAAYARPGGVVFSHREAHIMTDEAGAAEFFGSGVKVIGLDGAFGKLEPRALSDALERLPEGSVHHGRPIMVSVTQVNEFGVAYRPVEVTALGQVARPRGMVVHMDGARFANAVAALDLTPADVTWRAGVDVLSFGGTKNGCIAAEAVVFFDPDHARDFGFIRQRAGQGFSKNWFIAAQFDAYLENDHWLDLARHANAMATQLAAAIESSGAARLALHPDANEVFAVLPKLLDDRLRGSGAVYHPWPAGSLREAKVAGDEVLVRFVTSFQTRQDEIERVAAILRDG